MSIIIISLAVVLLFAYGLYSYVSGQLGEPSPKSTTPEHRYCKQGPLLSPAERLFYKSLEQVVAGQYLVMCKARLADVIAPKSSGDRSKRQSAFNKISSKHFDFVLCEPESFGVVAAVELDDKSHQSKSAQQRDKVKNDSCESAGLPLIRFAAKRRYNPDDIYAQLAEQIHLEANPSKLVEDIGGAESEAEPEAPQDPSPEFKSTEESSEPRATPSCPKCDSATVLRKVSKGKSAGKMFWVCSDYPGCRGALPQLEQ